MMSDLLKAAKNADWMQVVFNHGPPCFHLEDGRFCLRAERWDGHFKLHDHDILIHKFVPLEALLRKTRADALRHAAELCARQANFQTSLDIDNAYLLAAAMIAAEAAKVEEGKA